LPACRSFEAPLGSLVKLVSNCQTKVAASCPNQ
jgi:hypothetical protein